MIFKRSALLLAAHLLLFGTAFGNNNFFLPGDAYFPTVLTEEKLAKLKADHENTPVFEYSSLGGYEGAFCGYAGYQRAAIPGLDEAFVANLMAVYSRIRDYERKELVEIERDGNRGLVETNGMRVLFYSKEFEFPKYRIGLRYNENWVEEVVKFGHTPRHIRLCCLIDDADAVMESWRDANSVAGLKVALPEVELKPVPETIEPVTLRNGVKAIVLDSRPLIEYFRPHEDEMPTVYIVDSSSIRELSYENDSWKENKGEE